MIRKLKRKFLLIGTLFMLLLMAAMVLTMNLVNYAEITSEADAVLDVLENQKRPMDGEMHFPDDPDANGPDPEGKDPEGREPDHMLGFIRHGMSKEIPYESRYFAGTVSEDGEIRTTDLSRIVSVDEDAAAVYLKQAAESGSARGFIGDFRYSKTSEGTGTRILFLDWGRKLDSFYRFLWISAAVGTGGLAVVFVAFFLAAGRIVAPIAESYEKQKRFISDAGHEIKTPLTIINANVDLLETDGEKEELSDIRQQTDRLTKLTNNLILLSKMEEAEHSIRKIEYPLSDLVSETVASFRAPALARRLDLETDIQPNLTANGSPDAIRQLVSVLMENAVKYAPEDGRINAVLKLHRKNAILTVSNTLLNPVAESDLTHLFDRFYRSDTSRNSETGGHGIGLSIAKAIVTSHGGTISASVNGNAIFQITVILPL